MRHAARTRVAVLALLVASIAGGCGGAKPSVVSVAAYPWPEVRGPLLLIGRAHDDGALLPLAVTADVVPKQLPDPLEQPKTPRLARDCPQGGAVVEIATSDGRTVRYGPCRRPDSIERLRLAMAASYRAYLSQRVPGAPPGTPAWLERLAWRLASSWQDAHPEKIAITLGAHHHVWMRGRFVCNRCGTGVGSSRLEGRVLGFTVDPATRHVVGFSARGP